MSTAAFQRTVADALAIDATPTRKSSSRAAFDVAAFAAQPGIAVHRNNVMVACIDALAANYPTVARLVGDEFFRATAAEFARGQLPEHPSLFDYGAAFADFLAGFAPAASVPYLADVARVDRWWLEAHVAADALVLSGTDFATRDPESLDRARLRLHPAVRFGWFDQPIRSIWQRNREASVADAGELEWRAEGVLVVRPNDDVEVHRIDAAAFDFLAACAHGATLAGATAHALARDADADLAAAFAHLVGAGTFAALEA
jgi:hypothetical protein